MGAAREVERNGSLRIEKRWRTCWEQGWQRGPTAPLLCSGWAIPFAEDEGMPRGLRGWLREYVRDVLEAIADQDQRARSRRVQ